MNSMRINRCRQIQRDKQWFFLFGFRTCYPYHATFGQIWIIYGNTAMVYGLLIVWCSFPLFNVADTWSGLGLILKGSGMETPLGEFLQRHPRAYNSDPAEMNKRVDPEALTISLEEQYARDPFLKLWCLVNYGFKEGKLYEYSVLWFDKASKIDARKEDFFCACLTRHGTGFRREAMKVNEGKPNESLAPVLVWRNQAFAMLASYSTYDDGKKGPQGSFTYAMLPPGDPFLDNQLIGKKLDAAALEHVFEKIAPALDEAVKKVSTDKK